MKAHHQVNVIRINGVLPHGNADKLEIIKIDGFQVVVGKGQFKRGDLAYYIPPDSVVPDSEEFSFLWAPNAYVGGVPERKRRITAKKLRGEWSEGLLMPTIEPYSDTLNGRDFYKPVDFALLRDRFGAQIQVAEGENIADFLGIYHYNPPEDPQSGTQQLAKPKGLPRTFRGWVNYIKMWLRGERREAGPKTKYPTYDVEAFKKYQNVFLPGEIVQVTEKIHGSNARFAYEKNIFGKGVFYVGSRNLWKSPESTCIWRRAVETNPWIEAFCRKYPGFALYGEVTPTQKQGGISFKYGSERPQFFIFDIRHPDGRWLEDAETFALLEEEPILKQEYFAPKLYRGIWNEELIKQFVDGKSTLDRHIREGIVIRAIPERVVHNLGRAQLKIVSNLFLEKENR